MGLTEFNRAIAEFVRASRGKIFRSSIRCRQWAREEGRIDRGGCLGGCWRGLVGRREVVNVEVTGRVGKRHRGAFEGIRVMKLGGRDLERDLQASGREASNSWGGKKEASKGE